MRAVWGPLVLVSWHWAYVGMSVGREPGNFRAFLGQKSAKNPFLSHFLVKIDGAIHRNMTVIR